MLVSLGLPWLPMPLTNTSPSILTHTCAAVFVLDLVAGVVALIRRRRPRIFGIPRAAYPLLLARGGLLW